MSLSFDSMAKLYDETRVFDETCFNSALEFLVDKFPPWIFSEVFEPGIGTGRIAVPLAERGYRITGVDISEEMLVSLEKRLAKTREALRMSFQKADVTRLPFPDAAFDMAVAVHLFYFVQDWRKAADEILRVVKATGPIVLMHTGTGAEIPFLNDRYKELCAEHGCSIRSVGVKSTREVVDYFTHLGFRTEQIRDRWQWTSHIRLDKALGHISSRAYSFTTVVPANIHAIVVKNLGSELQRQFGSLTTAVEVPNEIYIVLILRDY